MLRTTLGSLLIDSALPEAMRGQGRVLDKKGVADLFKEVAEKYPEQYRDIAHNISNVGHDASTSTGGYSFGLKSLRTPVATRAAMQKLESRIDEIRAGKNMGETFNYMSPSDKEKAKETAILQTTTDTQKTLGDDVLAESKAVGNPLAGQITSGARGNKTNLSSLLGSDLLYVDHRDRPIPMPILRNYSQGLRPAEYFAGAFGARKGIHDLKMSTANAGFLGKQLSQVSHRLLVSAEDDDSPDPNDAPRGLTVNTLDPDNEGALLAADHGDFKRNTPITAKVAKSLAAAGHDQILIRSPLVGGPADGGVYANAVGIREKGRLAPRGDYVGIASAQALSSPVTQAAISSKHSGGVAGASAGAISGFKYLNALVQNPKIFPGGAAHARTDGRVDGIREAPQGGNFVTINGEEHYVGADYPVSVKPGDAVEAGDTISAGIPSPGEVVKYKGVGEGRRYFVEAFHKAMKDSGIGAHRRNIELLGRGLINHVRLTDELGDYSPDDVLPYQTLEKSWVTRPGTVTGSPRAMANRYLEKPVLHYTIGTQLKPSVVNTLEKHGVTQIHAHPEAPPFVPEMIRGMANVAHDQDWLSRMLGSYQSQSLLSGVHRGATSDASGSSYVPALASGQSFGSQGLTKAWKV